MNAILIPVKMKEHVMMISMNTPVNVWQDIQELTAKPTLMNAYRTRVSSTEFVRTASTDTPVIVYLGSPDPTAKSTSTNVPLIPVTPHGVISTIRTAFAMILSITTIVHVNWASRDTIAIVRTSASRIRVPREPSVRTVRGPTAVCVLPGTLATTVQSLKETVHINSS